MGMTKISRDDLEDLSSIKEEMLELLEKAAQIVRSAGNNIETERMRGYWYAQIKTALTHEHSYMGKAMFTMENTINSLEAHCDDSDEDEDDIDDEE